MDCREFKNQFEDGFSLGEKAKNHLETCGDCQTFQSEELQLTQMIQSLPKVEAPNDFEFGFKSKLANEKLKQPLSPIWQMLRYALPLTAAALIFGFVVVNSNLFTGNNQQTPQIAQKQNFEQKETTAEKPLLKDEGATNETVAENEAVEQNETENPSQDTEKPAEIIKPKPESSEVAENKPTASGKKNTEKDEILTRDIKPEIRSIDETFTIEKPINPRGINPDKKITNPRMSQAAKSFTAKEILSQLGILTSANTGGLTVTSVRKNSAGDASGVKIGDIITAIDGQSLSTISTQKRSVQGKVLRVKRNNKSLNIRIR